MARSLTCFNTHFFQNTKKVLYRETPGHQYLPAGAEMEDRLAMARKKKNIPEPKIPFLRVDNVKELDGEEEVHLLTEKDIEEVRLPDVRDMKDRFALDKKTFLDPKHVEPIYDSTGTLFGMGKKEKAYREQDAREILGKKAYEALKKEAETPFIPDEAALKREREQRIEEARNALLEVVNKVPETRPAQAPTGISTEIPNPGQAPRPKGLSGLLSRVTRLFRRG